VGAAWIAESTRHDDNGVLTVLMVGVAVTLTLATGGFAIASGIRCFVHRVVDEDMQAVCRRLDRVVERLGSPVSVSASSSSTDISEGMRGYLAARMELPD
jgi:hypothetical protein